MMETIDISCGERRNVYIAIKSLCRQPFEVSNPKFKLSVGDEVDQQGECEIVELSQDEVLLGALIQPMRPKCLCNLHFEYEIFPTKLYYDIKVRVS